MKKFVSISGPDGVGKTSTIAVLHKNTNYTYVIYDRDIPDQICYAKLAHRNIDSEWETYMINNTNQLYVILNADIEKIKERMKNRNDSFVPEGTTLEQAVEYFKGYKNSTSDNIFYIDNTNLTVEEVVRLILNKLQFKAQ